MRCNILDEVCPCVRLHCLAERLEAEERHRRTGPRVATNVEDDVLSVIPVSTERDAACLGMSLDRAYRDAVAVRVNDTHLECPGHRDLDVHLITHLERGGTAIAASEPDKFRRREFPE